MGARPTSSASASRTGSLLITDVNPRFGGAFPCRSPRAAATPELALALANGERPEPTVGEFSEGMFMTRFFSTSCSPKARTPARALRRGDSPSRSRASPASMSSTRHRAGSRRRAGGRPRALRRRADCEVDFHCSASSSASFSAISSQSAARRSTRSRQRSTWARPTAPAAPRRCRASRRTRTPSKRIARGQQSIEEVSRRAACRRVSCEPESRPGRSGPADRERPPTSSTRCRSRATASGPR